jgi:RNA polymerase sigma-B factor
MGANSLNPRGARNNRARLSDESVDVLLNDFATTRDPWVRDELIRRHQGLAFSLAARACNHPHDHDDRMQVALVGLMNALERFDPERGASFLTFAWATITGELKRFHRGSAWYPHVPRSLQEVHLRVTSAIDFLTAELGRSPTVPEIAAATGDIEEAVIEGIELNHARSPLSLDTLQHPQTGEGYELSTGTDGLGAVDDKLRVEALLDVLSPRSREIVRLRFAGELSQAQIAERIGLSQMHVSRLLAQALHAMREASARVEGIIRPA